MMDGRLDQDIETMPPTCSKHSGCLEGTSVFDHMDGAYYARSMLLPADDVLEMTTGGIGCVRRVDRRRSTGLASTLSASKLETSMSSDKVAAFAGTLAEFYNSYLVPLSFAPYAEVVADRTKALFPRRVLETAAGTGVVTEALARVLPTDVTITATDLNQAMIDRGKIRPGMERVNWQQADAMRLPFQDCAFDLIVCQFGVMFFPDKRVSFIESFRVLTPGGTYLFVLWDDYANMPDHPGWIAAQTVGDMLGRDPHTLVNPAYFDEPTIRADLAAAGFRDFKVDRILRTARAASARDA